MNISGIRKAFELAQKLKEPINLSIGQPDFSTPEKIKQSAQQAITENKNSYSLTFGIPKLRQKVAEKLRKENKIEWATQDNTIITSAVSGGLSVVLPTLIDPGDEVIIFDPYFIAYKQLVLLFNGVPIFVPKKEDFSVDFEILEKSITPKTKVIIINTPENPTGYVWSRAELERLAKIAQKHNLIIISDEIYEKFTYDKQRPHISIGSIYPRTVTLGGFSKSHAMTGWRVGWLQAPDEIIGEVMKVQQFTFVCAPTPFQYASLEIFNDKIGPRKEQTNKQIIEEEISKHIKEYKKRSEILYQGLKEKYQPTIKPSGAFYLFLKYPYQPEKFIKDCLDHNLLVIPGNTFSEQNTHFRLSFATPPNNLKKAVKILNRLASI